MKETIEIYRVPGELREMYEENLPPDIKALDPVLFGACDAEKEMIVGVLAVTDEDEEAYIAYIEVAEDYRRTGIGSALVNLCVTSLRAIMIQQIFTEYALEAGSSGDGVGAFFEACGFSREASVPIKRVKISDMDRSFAKGSNMNGRTKVTALDFVSSRDYDSLFSKVESRGMADSVGSGDFFLRPDPRETYDAEISSFAYNESKVPCGCLMTRKGSDGVNLCYLYNEGKGAMAQMLLWSLMKQSFLEAKNQYPDDGYIYANLKNPKTDVMFDTLAGGKSQVVAEAVEMSINI